MSELLYIIRRRILYLQGKDSRKLIFEKDILSQIVDRLVNVDDDVSLRNIIAKQIKTNLDLMQSVPFDADSLLDENNILNQYLLTDFSQSDVEKFIADNCMDIIEYAKNDGYAIGSIQDKMRNIGFIKSESIIDAVKNLRKIYLKK